MALSFDQTTISRIQQASDIVEVVGEHLSLAKKGREMVGLCPFHEDHKPSLYVNPAKQIFKCFACGAGGDVFKFLQMREGLTFPQAVERLANRAGIEVKTTRTKSSKRQVPDIDPNRLAKLNTWADKHFQKNLFDKKTGGDATEYLLSRGITLETAGRWHIGLATGSANELSAAAKAVKIPDELLKSGGLVTERNASLADRFVNRLMFAITDVTGRVIGFGGRTLDGQGAKYINSPATVLFDKSNCLYGLEQARHKIVSSNTAVVVEGYTDCIMAHQYGFKNVVATLGTSFTEGHGRILKRYARNVVLVFDSDTAGIAAANRALDICLALQLDIKIATIDGEKDPCDYLVEAGKEKFGELLNNAVDVFEFKYDRFIQSFEGDETIAGRKAAVEEFLQAIATAVLSGRLGGIEEGLIVNRLARISGLEKAQINSELKKKINTVRRAARHTDHGKAVNVDLGEGLFAAAQREIIEVLLNEPKLFENVRTKITPEQFDVPALSEAANAVFEAMKQRPEASLTNILSRIESVELSALVVKLSEDGLEKGNFEARICDALEAFIKCRSGKAPSEEQQNKKQYLEQLSKKARKRNPHSIGMT